MSETVTGDGSQVAVSLHVWVLQYPVRDDRILGELTVGEGEEGEGSSASCEFTHVSYPENDQGVCGVAVTGLAHIES